MTVSTTESTVSATGQAREFVARLFADVDAAESTAKIEPTRGRSQEQSLMQQVGQADLSPAPTLSGNYPMDYMVERDVLILGLGASGLAMARWCVRCGARVTVVDTRPQPPQRDVLCAELPQVSCIVARTLDASLLQGGTWSAVYCSPGLSPADVVAVVKVAKASQIPVKGELGLYAEAIYQLRMRYGYCSAVLAITGTNGKTTVATLTGLLLERAGKSVAVAGNIGPTLLDTLGKRLDTDTLPQAWVLELSSFQLTDIGAAFQGENGEPEKTFDLEPCVATVLNVTQDHLDWHGSLHAYTQAKARIFGKDALMVLNRDDEQVMAMWSTVPGTCAKPQQRYKRNCISFGSNMPQQPGDFGIEVVDGMAWLVRAWQGDEVHQTRNVNNSLSIQRLLPVEALHIQGRHNATNALAALALAHAAGCVLAPMLYGLREYRGEPHRMQAIGVVCNVEYFDDSKGTNVGAAVAALTGLGAERSLVVILGGDGKGQDFSPLAAPLARHARAAMLIGCDAQRLRAALQDTGIPLIDCGTLDDAVQTAAQYAQTGDAVLLSPACASWDMFANYIDRARVFRKAVQGLVCETNEMIPPGAQGSVQHAS